MKNITWFIIVIFLFGCASKPESDEAISNVSVAEEPTSLSPTSTIEIETAVPTLTPPATKTARPTETPIPTNTPTSTKTPDPTATPTSVPISPPSGLCYQVNDEIYQVDDAGNGQFVATPSPTPVQLGRSEEFPIWIGTSSYEKEDGSYGYQTILHDTVAQKDTTLMKGEVYKAAFGHAEVIASEWILLRATHTEPDTDRWFSPDLALVRTDGSDFQLLECDDICPFTAVFEDKIAYGGSAPEPPRIYQIGVGYLPVDTSAWIAELAWITDYTFIGLHPSWSPNGRYLSWKINSQGGLDYANIVIYDTQTNEVFNFYTEPALDELYGPNPQMQWTSDSQMAYGELCSICSIYIININDFTSRRWGVGAKEIASSPDQKWLFFKRYRNGDSDSAKYVIVNWDENPDFELENEIVLGKDVTFLGWSPDSQYVVFTVPGDNHRSFLLNPATGERKELPANVTNVIWEPNGGEHFVISRTHQDTSEVKHWIGQLELLQFERLDLPENSQILDWLFE